MSDPIVIADAIVKTFGKTTRALAAAPTVQGQVLLSLAWSVGILVAFVPLAIRIYRRTVT